MSPLNNPPVAFDVVVVGSGGGPDETNLSASVYTYNIISNFTTQLGLAVI
jgi:hypothetical protein